MQLFIYAVFAALVILGESRRRDDSDDDKKEPDLTVTHEVWMDIEIKDYDGPGEDYRGRIVIGLFGNEAPMTALNFLKLANGFSRDKGSRSEKLNYKNTVFHRLIRDFVIQGGDVTTGDGTGGKSVYGDKFNDEGFTISHKAKGYVSMANHGRDTNGSQFFILLGRARWLDAKHVCFGKVVRGMDVIHDMGEVPVTQEIKPKNRIKIVDCGGESLSKPYKLSSEEAESESDVIRD